MRYIGLLSVALMSLLSVASGSSAAQNEIPLRLRAVMESLKMDDVKAENSSERLDFYSSCGLHAYFYAPTDDPSRTAKGWKFLYPDRDRKHLLELMEACRGKGLEFVWTIDPSDGYSWTEADYDYLKNKLVIMYHAGVRSFALSLTGDSASSHDPREIYARLQKDFVAGRREPVTLYLLNSCTVVDYPSSSRDPRVLMQGVVLEKDVRESAVSTSSIICNMKERSELSKLAVIAIADFASSPDGYDPVKARQRAVEMLVPEVKDAYLTFLRHSSGVDGSSGVGTFTLKDYSEQKAEALKKEFERVAAVRGIMKNCASTELLKELEPWLVEFEKLGLRGVRAIECIDHYLRGDLGRFWISYIGNLMSEADKAAYDAHKCGEAVLQPFYENIMSELTEAFTRIMTGKSALASRPVKPTPLTAGALDSDFSTSVQVNGRMEVVIPPEADICHILTGALPDGEMVFLRQLGADGKLIAEFIVKSPYMSMELKKGAAKIDILGNVEVFETIFVSL